MLDSKNPLSRMNMESKNERIPPELIEEILLRLPTKSIVRFRSLSKQYLSHTSDPNFIDTNFNLCASNTNGFLYIPHHNDSGEAIWVEVDASSLRLFHTVRLPVPYCDNLTIVGSCRGFILIKNHPRDPHLVLWNPLTGAHKTMSYCSDALPFNPEICCGFGYDESSDDYLVVVVRVVPCDYHSFYENGILWRRRWRWELFSVRNNSWEKIAVNFRLDVDFDRKNGLFFNGAIHWLGINRSSPESPHVIVALEFECRSASEIRLPDLGGVTKLGNLIDCGGYLGFYCRTEHDFSIWVMKDYKVHSSWTILYSMFHPCGVIDPVCLNRHGELVAIKDKKHLVKFDEKGRLVQEHQQGDNHLRKGTKTRLPMRGVMFTATIITHSLVPAHHSSTNTSKDLP